MSNQIDRYTPSGTDIQVISRIVQDMMAPVMESIAKILERNSQAMEQIAATQQMMSQRIDDLEKEARVSRPVSPSQEKHIKDAAREKARKLLESKGLSENRKAVNQLSAAIRKSVLARYGAGSLREVPAYDYGTAMEQIGAWMDAVAIMKTIREAQRDAEEAGKDS